MRNAKAMLFVWAVFMGPVAMAARDIQEWGGATGGFTIEDDLGTIVISAAGTYKFQSLDGAQLADIDSVTIQSGVTGDVHLVIARNPAQGGGAGASDLRACNLSGTANTYIDELSITGDLGADAITIGDHLAGDLALGGSLLRGLTLSDAGTVTIDIGGDLDGDIIITSDAGGVSIDIGGALDNFESIQGPNFGDISITNDVKSYANILLTSGYEHTLSIGGKLSGGTYVIIGGATTDDALIDVAGDVDGTIWTEGDAEHRVVIGEDLNGTLQYDQAFDGDDTDGAPEIDITGNMATDSVITVGGDWAGGAHVVGSVSGEFRIAGSFIDNSDGSVPNIQVDGTFSAIAGGAAVAVDWDGYDTLDGWQSGAEVKISDGMGGYDTYTGNSPSQQIWETTCLKGDLNNDGAVNTYDIDPFVLALTDQSGYDEAFPGLLGSRLYHADLDCSGALNTYDIDPFVLRLTDAEAYCAAYYDPDTCYDCDCAAMDLGGAGGGGEGIGDDPADVAAMFKEYVAEERLPAVVELVAELAEVYGDTPRGEFWAAVLDELK